MIRLVADEDIGDSTNDAPGGWVILAGAHDPISSLFNMDLSTRVVISEDLSWHGRHWVLLVIDVRNVSWELRVDQVRPCLITDAR